MAAGGLGAASLLKPLSTPAAALATAAATCILHFLQNNARVNASFKVLKACRNAALIRHFNPS